MSKFGCNKVNKDFRDYKFKGISSYHLPSEYKLKKNLKIKDQGVVSSCVAHTLSSFEEYTYGGDFSTNFIYGHRPKTYFQGEGMNMRDALHTLVKYGDCSNLLCPGNDEVPEVIEKITKNIDTYLIPALPFRIKSYARIFTERQIKELLVKDIPVPISIPIKGDLYVRDGIIRYDRDNTTTGYHAILAIGYTEQGWIVQNSWGEHWGNNGMAILPYEYPIDSAWALNISGDVVIKEPIRWLAVIGNFIFNLFRK